MGAGDTNDWCIKINGNPVREATRLAIKLKLVTDTYILQAKSTRFGNRESSTKCLLCEVEHFLTCIVAKYSPDVEPLYYNNFALRYIS